jgi:hypothetical protein
MAIPGIQHQKNTTEKIIFMEKNRTQHQCTYYIFVAIITERFVLNDIAKQYLKTRNIFQKIN